MIRWITPRLGTAPYNEVDGNNEVEIVDVRAMVDKAGNAPAVVRKLVDSTVLRLRSGRRVVVCCDNGMSRSNAIAAAVLATAEGTTYDEALQTVLSATGERSIRLEVISVVREALQDRASGRQATRKRSVLVTGGHGFLGRAVVKLLGAECRVLAPERRVLDLEGGAAPLDLAVRRDAITDLVHLAHPRVFTSNEAMGSSLVMLRNVLDVCGANSVRLVFLSGWEIYSGYDTAGMLASEQLAPRPRGPYGEAKYLCECLLRHHEAHHGLRLALLRFGPVYGPGSDKPRFIHTFIRKARLNQPIVTHRYANGDPSLDLTHIDDAAQLIAMVAGSSFTGQLNAGTGRLTSTPDVARLIIGFLHSHSEITHSPVAGHVANIAMDTTKLKSQFAWSPRVPVEAGLEELCRATHLA